MAKAPSSRATDRNTPQPKAHVYTAAVFADDYGRLSRLTVGSANTFAAKKLDAASQRLQLRLEKRAIRADALAHAAAERGLQAEMRATERGIRMFHRALKTKVRPGQKLKHRPPKARKREWPRASRALPKYDGPVIDRRGERGIFLRTRYYSRKTAGQGVSQRLVRYVFHGAAVDDEGNPYIDSNVGLTIDETMCAFDHLEQINWSAQKNAKLLMHSIMAVDHRQTQDEMMRTGTLWAEKSLGQFGLPYLVTLHAPPPDGDERNWHLHILWSFRPLERVGDHEWEVAEMLRTDLDNPAAMKLMRAMYAAAMTEVSFEAGQHQVYTAKTNAARGLVHEPQVHLGAALTNRARDGEFVAANEENHERVVRSKAAVLDEDLRHADDVLAARQAVDRDIAERWARLPMLPLRVPESIIAATLSATPYAIDEALPAAPITIAVPAPLPGPRTRSTILAVEPIASAITELPTIADARATSATSLLSSTPLTSAPMKIANLRFSHAQVSRATIAVPGRLPQEPFVTPRIPLLAVGSFTRPLLASVTAEVPSPGPVPMRATAATSVIPSLPTTAMPRASNTVLTAVVPAAQIAAASMIQLEKKKISVPLPIAASDTVNHALRRSADARRQDEGRREDEHRQADRDLGERYRLLAAQQHELLLRERQRLDQVKEKGRAKALQQDAANIEPAALALAQDIEPTPVDAEAARRRMLVHAADRRADLMKGWAESCRFDIGAIPDRTMSGPVRQAEARADDQRSIHAPHRHHPSRPDGAGR